MELSTSTAARASTLAHATPAANAAAGDDGRFADALQSVAATPIPDSLLTSADKSSAHRPDLKTFMDASGASFEDAAELVYGVVGSNTDTRNWQAIMASGDPVTAARRATGQMYGEAGRPRRDDATYLGAQDTLARSGQFALRQLKDEDGAVVDAGLKLVDAHGLLLRDAGSDAASIRRHAWLFGFDLAEAAPLVARAAELSPGLQAQLRAAIDTPAAPTAAGAHIAPGETGTALPDGAAPVMDAALLAEAAGDASVAADGDGGDVAADELAAAALSAAAFVDTRSVLHSLLTVVDS